MRVIEDITGQRYGRLVAIENRGVTPGVGTEYRFRCDCGGEITVLASRVRSGTTSSCGCLRRERHAAATTSHGLSRHPLFRVWTSMKQRCLNPANKHYAGYGGRGISLCEEWLDFQTFYDWSMSNGYQSGLTIDRENNDGPYAPTNCRWVGRHIQNRNHRRNRFVMVEGNRMILADAAKLLGVPATTLGARLTAGSVAEAILKDIGV